MSDILFTLITALQVVSALAALFTVFKPGTSERTRHRAFSVMTAATLLAAVAHLMSGHMLAGTLFAALTALLLVTWGQVPRVLVRWVRARKDEKSRK
ncbi:hypothetical protein OG413_41495 [Streptomyces sp. NBC_01433]|uniref:hypothetical protein n=1 Tax=Streptomyces sp. NBC_01433 TaxID=2903864 RepID=UPI00225BD83C|nr:hypothetical protein [Streptomyces sp. NBC_01433]MCX4681679.1 hypothetical protein [Streptomyces sp. NBC_01433]